MEKATILRSVYDLHPNFIGTAQAIDAEIRRLSETGVLKASYKVFETLRLPTRQAELLANGASKAGPWQSDHQFGLAFDIAGWNGDWSWVIPAHDFVVFSQLRARFGAQLAPVISWDRLHFASPLGWHVRDYLR